MTALALLTIPGTFTSEYRNATVLVGFLILLWIPTLPVPRGLHRITALLASSSLYIYVTHWLVYPLLDQAHKEPGRSDITDRRCGLLGNGDPCHGQRRAVAA